LNANFIYEQEMKKNGDKDNSDGPKIWGAVLFGLIGATATTLVVSFFDFWFSQID
jgi:hypothetical protein